MRLNLALALAAVCVFVGGCGVAVSNFYATHTASIHVTGKESVAQHNSNQYRVYTPTETFSVEDTVGHFRFNSSDLYRELQPGHTYRCRVFGYRMPLLSGFRNILDCDGLHS